MAVQRRVGRLKNVLTFGITELLSSAPVVQQSLNRVQERSIPALGAENFHAGRQVCEARIILSENIERLNREPVESARATSIHRAEVELAYGSAVYNEANIERRGSCRERGTGTNPRTQQTTSELHSPTDSSLSSSLNARGSTLCLLDVYVSLAQQSAFECTDG